MVEKLGWTSQGQLLKPTARPVPGLGDATLPLLGTRKQPTAISTQTLQVGQRPAPGKVGTEGDSGCLPARTIICPSEADGQTDKTLAGTRQSILTLSPKGSVLLSRGKVVSFNQIRPSTQAIRNEIGEAGHG